MESQEILKNKIQNFHFVYFTDEQGVFNAFEHVKGVLAQYPDSFLSFIYAVSKNSSRFLFQQELEILEQRFQKNLIVYPLIYCSSESYINQEFIEALINSNISENMNFLLFGNSEFIYQLTSSLGFLGIQSVIISKSINN